jgi:DUF1009 family protein
MEAQGALGILAGGGLLPGAVAAAASGQGRAVFIIGLDGFADPTVLAPYPHALVRLGAAGQMRRLLDQHGCRDLVLVGAVRRPSMLHLRPDAEGVRILARIGRAAFQGDDGMLKAVIRVLAEDGYRVLAVQDVLTDSLVGAGVLTSRQPDAVALADIARGLAVAAALGRADVGQGCVVQQGLVLAVEAIEGTDAMLARAGALAREGPGGVLVKLCKPDQDRRADLPTIGPGTVAAARAAGLRGIAVSAGGALLVQGARTLAAADAAGLFVVGLSEDEQAGDRKDFA